MEDDTKTRLGRRDQTMRFRVTAAEAKAIEARAGATGMSVSGFVRAAALNHPVKSVYDLEAVANLVRVNGDLGRVAGLLKLWLAEKPGQGARRLDVDQMMAEFRALQTELSKIMRLALK